MVIKHISDGLVRKFPALCKLGFGRFVMCFDAPKFMPETAVRQLKKNYE